MTFTEAALEVLEREGRPMHSREIAERAVELGILSHVGKTPVQTMSARLSASVAKGKENGPLVRIRPGVFALSKWKDGKAPSPKGGGSERSASSAPPADAAQKKKRRRRRKKKPDEPENGEATEAQPSPPTKPPVAVQEPKPAPASAEPPPEPKQPVPKPVASEPKATPAPKTTPAPMPHTKPPSSRADSEDLMDRVESILRHKTRPTPVENIFQELGLSGAGGTTLLEAMFVADDLEKERSGERPRFVKHRGGYALSAREVSSEILALERQVSEARARLIRIAEKQTLKKLRGMSMSGFIRVMVIYLQRSGFGSMVPVNLNRAQEFHLSVQDRRHEGRFRTAVVLRRDAADQTLSDRAVMDLRGALHHYDAMGGMIITTGEIGDRAKKEGRVPNLAPVALIDGETLAGDMVRIGIGVHERRVTLPSFDDGFFGALEA